MLNLSPEGVHSKEIETRWWPMGMEIIEQLEISPMIVEGFTGGTMEETLELLATGCHLAQVTFKGHWTDFWLSQNAKCKVVATGCRSLVLLCAP